MRPAKGISLAGPPLLLRRRRPTHIHFVSELRPAALYCLSVCQWIIYHQLALFFPKKLAECFAAVFLFSFFFSSLAQTVCSTLPPLVQAVLQQFGPCPWASRIRSGRREISNNTTHICFRAWMSLSAAFRPNPRNAAGFESSRSLGWLI